jgi:transcriptional regulator with XRE-family HTH domain
VLEGAVRLAVTASSSSSSNSNTGKLEGQLETDLEDLRMLATNGSERKFNEALQAAIVRLIRLTRKLLRWLTGYSDLKGPLMTLGNAIKLIRTARGVKQVDLAKSMKTSPNYISLVEKDKREPSVSFLARLAKELGVPLSMLFMCQELEGSPKATAELRELAETLIRLQSMSSARRKRGR